jgi:hypothetical protein
MKKSKDSSTSISHLDEKITWRWSHQSGWRTQEEYIYGYWWYLLFWSCFSFKDLVEPVYYRIQAMELKRKEWALCYFVCLYLIFTMSVPLLLPSILFFVSFFNLTKFLQVPYVPTLFTDWLAIPTGEEGQNVFPEVYSQIVLGSLGHFSCTTLLLPSHFHPSLYQHLPILHPFSSKPC